MTEQRFISLLLGLAKLCRETQLDETMIEIYDKALAQYGYGAVCEALESIISDRDTQDPFPSIKDIRLQIAGCPLPDELQARDIASRIVAAVSRIGSIQGAPGPGSRWESLEKFVGSAGMEVIRLQGGWNSICETLTYKNVPQLQAQWRDIAVTVLKRARRGETGPPALPESEVRTSPMTPERLDEARVQVRDNPGVVRNPVSPDASPKRWS